MAYVDKTLTCRDCGSEFTFTAGEQEFYASRGFENEPSRCPNCRASRRSSSQRGGSSYGGGSYGDRQQRQMYPAVCAGCGAQTEVPFRPMTDKPVYCSDCFRKQRSSRY